MVSRMAASTYRSGGSRMGKRALVIDFPLALVYIATAISGLLPTSLWTAGSIPGTLPVWLLLLAVILALPRIRKSPVVRFEKKMAGFFVYVLLLAIVGLFLNPLRWWLFDINAIVCFFGAFYFLSIYWDDVGQINRLVLFSWLAHFLGGLILMAQVLSSGRSLEMFVYASSSRFSVAGTSGFDDAWKIMLAGRMSPYMVMWALSPRRSHLGFPLLLGVAANLGLVLLTLSRTIFISFSVSLLVIFLYVLFRLRKVPLVVPNWELSHLVLSYIVALAFLIFVLLVPKFGQTIQAGSDAVITLIDRMVSRGTSTGYGPDTVDLRVREVNYLLGDLTPWEWIFGRGIGGTFNPSDIYPFGIDVTRWLAGGGTPYSHNNILTLLLKGGLVMIVATLIVFPRYFLVDLRRLTSEDLIVYLASVTGLGSYLIAAIIGGPVHYLTGMIPFGAMLACAAGLRCRLMIEKTGRSCGNVAYGNESISSVCQM